MDVEEQSMAERQIQPWERLDAESDPAWEAFMAYRDMGVKRSQAKVGELLGKSTALMNRWSARHNWVARSTAWDREDDRLFLNEQRSARKTIARKQQRLAVRFQSKALERLKTLKPDELSASDLIKWLDISTRLEAAAADVDLDTTAYKKAMAETASPLQKYDRMTDEERGERMAALQRELQNRIRVGAEELEKAEETRAERAAAEAQALAPAAPIEAP